MTHPALVALGWDDRLAARAADLSPDLQLGRVTRVDRGRCTVSTSTGERRATTAHLREPVAVGDWVALDDADRVREVVPRWSGLTRRAPGEATASLILAANVDRVLILQPLDTGVNQRRLERELIVAWETGAAPLVVLTKSDLCHDMAGAVADAQAVALGADVVAVSCTRRDGLDDLRRHLGRGRTVVLIGASGAGKSTLLNALAGDDRRVIGAVRSGDGRGRHTTTAAELEVLPDGTLVVDTPGIRAVALWDGDEGLSRVFADVDALAEECRFTDCSHDTEPGCSVRDAVDPDRLVSWHKLRRELARTTADRAGWEVAESRKRLRARMRSYKDQTPRP